MRNVTISPEEFVRQLDALSYEGAVPYKRIELIRNEERKHRQTMLSYKGHFALSDAFKCFFLETVERLNKASLGPTRKFFPPTYVFFLPRIAYDFRSLCAAERVAMDGYPYHRYILLRNVFDNLVLTSAVFQGFADFQSIEGLGCGFQPDLKSIRKARKNLEFSIKSKMVGRESGLSEATIEELSKWDELFDLEVDGGRLSYRHQIGSI